MRIIFLLIMITAMFCQQSIAQVNARTTTFVTPENRSTFNQYILDTTIGLALQQPLNKIVESQWKGAFWGMELMNVKQDTIATKLHYLLNNYSKYSDSFRRALLEVAYALYPIQFKNEIGFIANQENNNKRFAMCVAYLSRFATNSSQKQLLQQFVQQRFPSWKDDAILFSLYNFIDAEKENNNAFSDLKKMNEGKKIIYSFQRSNRDYAGLAIVQNADGSFVKDEKGHVKMFEQFARASSNLPYFITNGNTPQGVLAIEDTATSENDFIGPTPNFQTRLPFESNTKTFFLGTDSTGWTLEKYLSLFPSSWQQNTNMQQSFYAGKAGRTEIIAHGTCIDPNYYKSDVYYPYTPSMGCLTGKEIWNNDGTIAYSAQLDLMNAWLSTPGIKGYLFVINLADKNTTVQREEVEALLK